MTENVVISCDAEGGEWDYIGQTGTTLNGVANPVTIDLFTIEYAGNFYCKSASGSRKLFHKVYIVAVGKYLVKLLNYLYKL